MPIDPNTITWDDAPAPVQPRGPVYGPPPKAPAPPSPYQVQRDSVADQYRAEDQQMQRDRFQFDMDQARRKAEEDKTKAGSSKEAMKAANLDSIIGQINRVQDLYNRGIRDETLLNGFGALDSIGPSAGQFDAAGQAIADQGLAAFRVPGVGAQSDMEARQFALANTPQSGNWDAAIEEKLRTMRARVDANRKAMGLPPADWTGIDGTDTPDAAAVPPAAAGDNGGSNPPRIPGDGGGQVQAATGATRSTFDANLSSQLDQLLRSGASFNELNQAAMQAGGQPISPREYAEARKFLRANPNYDKLIVNVQRYQPQTTFERAASAVGSTAAGNYAMNAGQMLSGNTLDNLASDPERARMAMDISNAQNPTAATLGQLTGGVMAGLAGEAGLARLGVAGGLGRGVAADAVAGAANGAGMADGGDRLSGLAKGAASSAAGSAAGGVAVKGIGRALNPTGGSLASLYAEGVRPTLGQRLAQSGDGGGLKGMVGGAVNATEEALQSVPIVGSAIRGARQEARNQFQVGAFNQALREVGEELPAGMGGGASAHVRTKEVFDRVYDEARSGMVMVADEGLANDLGNLSQVIGTLAEPSQKRFAAIYKNVVERRAQNGQMGGDAYKKAQSELGKVIASIGKSKTGDDELAGALTDLSHALDSAARRHSPEESVKLLDAADRGYAKYVRIKEASKRRGGGAGEFTPNQLDAAVQKESSGPRSEQYLRGEALMQDYAKQGMSLADRLPNSGSADRIMAGYAVGAPVAGASVWANPLFAGLYTAIGTAYAPGARKVMQGALAPSAGKRKAIAAKLKKIERLTSATSGALALQGTTPSP